MWFLKEKKKNLVPNPLIFLEWNKEEITWLNEGHVNWKHNVSCLKEF